MHARKSERMNPRWHRGVRVICCLACCATAYACGEDEDAGAPDGGGGATGGSAGTAQGGSGGSSNVGGGGTAGTAGTGGTAGSGGTSGSGGTAGTAGASGSAGAGGNDGFVTLPGKDGSEFVPAWRDEFDGPQVDPSKWYVLEEFPTMDQPWRRNWKASNVSIENGALVIQTIKETDGSFSTGAVRTGGYGNTPWLFSQTYGRFEARWKRPKQQGHWSAFWLFSPDVNKVDGSGQDGTEIDIAELARLRDEVHHALHWDGYGADHQSEGYDAMDMGTFDDDWHTVAVEWYPDEYVFYVDGVETWRTSAGGVCQVPLYVKLTEEIANYGEGEWAWGTGPIEDANLPDYFRVDYVRVWEYVPGT